MMNWREMTQNERIRERVLDVVLAVTFAVSFAWLLIYGAAK